MKRFLDLHIPVTSCNLKCHYCYVGQQGERDSKPTPMEYNPEYIGKALSPERLGGICHFNLCGIGETLIPKETFLITKELLKQGHYLMIVTNGLLTQRLQEYTQLPEEYRSRLGFKMSFHYLELKKKGLLDTFVQNVELTAQSGMSYSIEMTPTDELEPYIEEVQSFCMEHFGALCHVTIPRDMTKPGIELLSKHSFEEFCRIWETFDSALFDFKKAVWGKKRQEYCYAGAWSGLLNLGNGQMSACYSSKIQQNIFQDIQKPIDFIAVGCNCRLPHCYNSHSLLGMGDIPQIQGSTYAQQRDRVDCRTGRHWLTPQMREFLSHRLEEENQEFSQREKTRNSIQAERRILYSRGYILKRKLKKKFQGDKIKK